MGSNQRSSLAILTIVLSVLYAAEALRCYKCTSFEQELCADYFNQTEIRRRMIYASNPADTQMPKEVDCGSEYLPYPSINQRAVCMKKIETEYGRRKFTRQCMFINRDQPTLECPRETPNNHRTLESCDVCETDLCNTASSLSFSAFALLTIPIIVAYVSKT